MTTFGKEFVMPQIRLITLGILVFSFASVATAQSIAGDWKGTLQAPNGNLPLTFHLDANGGGTVDSPAQNFSAPLQYQANGNRLTITVPSVNGAYAGTINGDQADGNWTQNGGSLPLALIKSAGGNSGGRGSSGSGSSNSAALKGDWQGTLQAPNGNLPLIFHLDGNGTGTVDSPAQNFSAPLQYSSNGNQVTITVPNVRGNYSGTVNGNHIAGNWSQNGGTLPLALDKH